MNLSAPTKITWYIAIALAVISLISILFTIPVINDSILFALIPFAGLVLMLVAVVTRKM
jgi:hypothetical protein